MQATADREYFPAFSRSSPRATRGSRPVAWLLALAAGIPSGCGGKEAPPALVADTADLPHTALVAALETPLDPERNQLWCASLPIAWKALQKEMGGLIRAKDPEPPSLALLNSSPVSEEDVDPSALTVRAGTRGGLETLRRERAERGLPPDPRLEELAANPLTQVFAYARLEKSVPFEHRFKDLEDAPIRFAHVVDGEPRNVTVDAFGLQEYDPTDHPQYKIAQQVRVWRYESPTDFVIELVPEDETDRILLARREPGASLAATWKEVAEAAAAEKWQRLAAGDRLAVPELDFDVVQEFQELSGLQLDCPELQDPRILAVIQDLRLRLDEEGMVVRSRTSMGATAAAVFEPRTLVLDGPFLLAAIEPEARNPYLVAWIAHPELLVAVP